MNNPTKPWTLVAHPLFLAQYRSLEQTVEDLKKKRPNDYKKSAPAKRLAAIQYLIREKIPQNPALDEYRQGNTLGPDHRHWFRAKFYQQYRLFLRFNEKQKIIIYAWVNDESTKRAYESKSDAYRVFSRMLQSGHPPDSWEQLLAESLAEDL